MRGLLQQKGQPKLHSGDVKIKHVQKLNSLDSSIRDNEKGDKNPKVYFDINVIFKMLTGKVKSVSTIYLEKLVRILLKTKKYIEICLIKMYLRRRSLLTILRSRFSSKAHAMDRFKDLLPTTVI